MTAKFEQGSWIAGHEDWYAQCGENIGRIRWHGRALRTRIVTDESDDATVGAGAGEHGVANRIAGAFKAWSFSVPDPDNALVEGICAGCDELRSHDRCCRVFFVDCWNMAKRKVGVNRCCAINFISVAAKRRPWVSAHKCCGIEPVVLVGHELLKGKPRKCLNAGKERRRLLLRVTVTQCVIVNRHVSMPPSTKRV